MKIKKLIALGLCAAMVSGMTVAPVFAAEEATEDAAETEDAAAEEEATTEDAADPAAQFEGLKANEAYEFPMMVKSFQSTYWQAAVEGMQKAADELGVTFTAQGPNSESDIADQVNMINTAIAAKPVGMGLAACDTSSVTDALKKCAADGIPVVTFDTGVADAPEGYCSSRGCYRQRSGWCSSS